MPGPTPAGIPRRHPVCAAHRVRVAAPAARLHPQRVRSAQALPAVVARRHVDHGAHRDPRRSPHPLWSTTPAHRGRRGRILGQRIPGRRAPRLPGRQQSRRRQTPPAGRLRRFANRRCPHRGRCAGPGSLPNTAPQGQTRCPTITHVWVDNGYTGSTVANAPGQGWSPCRRRVRPQTRPRLHRPATSLAGRTHQRLDQPLPPPRPPPRSHLNAHEGFPIPSQIDLLLRRLDSQLFDTL
jgi:hypothetical protein